MVIDPVMRDGFRFDDFFSDQSHHISNGLKIQESQQLFQLNHQNIIYYQKYANLAHPPPPPPLPPPPPPDAAESVARSRADSSFREESDVDVFSDVVLTYISRMLMEEDVDEKVNNLYHENSAIHAAEKPFYDILGEKYPPSPTPTDVSSSFTDDGSSGRRARTNSGTSNNSWAYCSPPPLSSSNSVCSAVADALESQPAWQFRKGVEEAQKFLPSHNKLVIDLEAIGLSFAGGGMKAGARRESATSRGRRKSPNTEDLHQAEGRSNKQSAVSALSDDTVRSDMFDEVLLCSEDKCANASALREAMQSGANRSSTGNANSRGPSGGGGGGGGGKTRGKKQTKKDVVDLRTLLVHCAQAVAADDRRTANELLKQIRKSSSPFGDGSQRLAHCFADGLEARLAGTGSQIYQSLVAKRTTATDILKAYQLYLAACPFKRVSHFYSNRTILNVTEKATRVHIIDFGIYFGFQWPGLIQRLSTRPGGPPKLRITGIDVPQPGFRPTERIEETGNRLADYARSFNVPFEYNAIASKWETIKVEDLKIDKEEVLIVNCMYRFRNLVDETVVVDSPRNTVLNTIRKANPDVFIHGIVNGSYSAPFFITRFREALFHYSALFDMLEMNVPREDEQRLLIERDLFGREALNVISCEGSERVERPETYKQWQVRNLRAGFRHLPLNPEIVKNARDKVKGCYHEDFVIDVDSQWLLQGWKGRIIYALSTWKPNRNC
ncbi:scarecrow-like protein 9 [Iris pallida]|uniref:Scarecrow-like protein 9 n=1 Tax=Iris pallida TaxID=29817 RepID=A0AAX6F0L5_IRIPA|nr:scarecrow-like protein 9 [Iris pallida]